MAGTDTGTPPPIAAWRAGFILLPAWMTLPMTTLPIAAASSPDRFSVSRTTAAPRSGAGIVFSEPLKVPIAVRTGLQRTISRVFMSELLSLNARHGSDSKKPGEQRFSSYLHDDSNCAYDSVNAAQEL